MPAANLFLLFSPSSVHALHSYAHIPPRFLSVLLHQVRFTSITLQQSIEPIFDALLQCKTLVRLSALRAHTTDVLRLAHTLRRLRVLTLSPAEGRPEIIRELTSLGVALT